MKMNQLPAKDRIKSPNLTDKCGSFLKQLLKAWSIFTLIVGLEFEEMHFLAKIDFTTIRTILIPIFANVSEKLYWKLTFPIPA